MMKLILASGSPRRKELLGLLNIPFEIIVADIDEKIDLNNPIQKEIEKLSYGKALAVFKDHEDKTVLGSDTIVTFNNIPLGKPKNEEDAKRMLKMLQGNKHQVITAVTIMSKEKSITFSSVSDVYFNKMSDEEIDDYIKTKEPMDKAGAYAIQGIGSKYISRIDGDYYAIMGLPVSKVYETLKEF